MRLFSTARIGCYCFIWLASSIPAPGQDLNGLFAIAAQAELQIGDVSGLCSQLQTSPSAADPENSGILRAIRTHLDDVRHKAQTLEAVCSHLQSQFQKRDMASSKVNDLDAKAEATRKLLCAENMGVFLRAMLEYDNKYKPVTVGYDEFGERKIVRPWHPRRSMMDQIKDSLPTKNEHEEMERTEDQWEAEKMDLKNQSNVLAGCVSQINILLSYGAAAAALLSQSEAELSQFTQRHEDTSVAYAFNPSVVGQPVRDTKTITIPSGFGYIAHTTRETTASPQNDRSKFSFETGVSPGRDRRIRQVWVRVNANTKNSFSDSVWLGMELKVISLRGWKGPTVSGAPVQHAPRNPTPSPQSDPDYQLSRTSAIRTITFIGAWQNGIDLEIRVGNHVDPNLNGRYVEYCKKLGYRDVWKVPIDKDLSLYYSRPNDPDNPASGWEVWINPGEFGDAEVIP